MPTVYNFKEWENTLRPCDLILFHMPVAVGNCIRFFQSKHLNIESTWGHCGIVCPQHFFKFNNNRKSNSYIIESLVSGFDGVMNVETNRFHNGLQIRNLKDVVNSILDKGGYVAAFHLKKNDFFPFTIPEERMLNDEELFDYTYFNKKYNKIREFWTTYKKASYDCYNCSKAVNCIIPCINTKNNAKKRLFCSEAAVRFYQHLDIMDKNIDAEKISPEELASWCGDIKGESPFEIEPSILKKFNI
tara:strand:+ start:15174 stop:15908 length:735 start_codon:yes stop_codon:yes gene_type:complete